MDKTLTKLPYGISNYKRIVEEGYYYVDKTRFLEELESFSEPYLFFLRPRRFGKSLWISMMSYYYGKEHKADFDKRAKMFEKNANALVIAAKSGDKGAIKKAVGALGKSCKGCHDNYKD